ncbi:hypothetical protein CBER1_09030 [Cercospora berteroae]|uniref:Uncharacterized protein n=1 Tax=Cercospora berteroae TaxID=357750 RepID=A0A2S6CC51_9PEZI|nr:hypothetical protein CBER1_09030 [Cercospora berteroae]
MARKKIKAMPAQTRKVAVMTRSKQRAADSDAAMRVFGVPELLEQILLSAASDQTPALDNKRSETLKLSPMPGAAKESRGGICIFSLQRVNKDFHATINGSVKLKRLVYLAPCPNKDLHASSTARKAQLPFHTPFFALMDKLLENSGDFLLLLERQSSSIKPVSADDVTTSMTLDIQYAVGKDKSLYQAAISKLGPGWWNSEANWRQIRVCNAKQLVSLTVTMSYFHWVEGPACVEFEDLTWLLQGDESLGYIFDRLCKLLQLIDEARAAIRLFERKWKTRTEELSARLKSQRVAKGHHRISKETRRAERREWRRLESKHAPEVEAVQEKLGSAVTEWELSVKREPEPDAQKAGQSSEK